MRSKRSFEKKKKDMTLFSELKHNALVAQAMVRRVTDHLRTREDDRSGRCGRLTMLNIFKLRYQYISVLSQN